MASLKQALAYTMESASWAKSPRPPDEAAAAAASLATCAHAFVCVHACVGVCACVCACVHMHVYIAGDEMGGWCAQETACMYGGG